MGDDYMFAIVLLLVVLMVAYYYRAPLEKDIGHFGSSVDGMQSAG